MTITIQTIEQMMQAQTTNNATPCSQEALIEIYKKLDFSKRAQTFELFMTENDPLPKKNPPFPASIFPERSKQIITHISYLLGIIHTNG